MAGINLRELSEYIQAVGQVPCKHSVSQFPVPKPTSQQLPQHLSFFNNWAQIDKFDETEDGELDSLHLLPPTPLSDTDGKLKCRKFNNNTLTMEIELSSFIFNHFLSISTNIFLDFVLIYLVK